MAADLRMLLEETKDFMRSVPEGSWGGRTQWREDLITRLDSVIDADAEREETPSGLRGTLIRLLARKE